MIEARQLVRRYGDFVAVADVSFRIEPGEVVGLLGHNGAGKTTIMKMLTGYLQPDSGSVLVDGVEVESDPLTVQAGLGYLPENLPLYPELTIVDYLRYVADLRGVDARTTVPAAIEATELGDKALQPINTLSRGYRQRVGVAQAILHKPSIVILDEPTSGLDPTQTHEMRRLITAMSESATVILSTHIMQEVSAMCTRALILRGGRLVLDEKLEDLEQSRQVVVKTRADADLSGIVAAGDTLSGGSGVWTVTVAEDPAQACARLTKAMVALDLPVYQITPARRDLETLFREVNEEA
ncbi:MAG: ABC transporter ATP-binding protein [Proteobacteria bacterium]|nr:ABC transporter ATP-binding protein [Pseudomonadota bacterium]